MDEIKKRKVYSPPGQGPPEQTSNLTAPSLEVPRKLSQASTKMKRKAVPITQRSFHTKQMFSQSKQEENKERSVQELDSTCKYGTTGTVDGRKISHQEPCEVLKSSRKKSEEDQDNKYEKQQSQQNRTWCMSYLWTQCFSAAA